MFVDKDVGDFRAGFDESFLFCSCWWWFAAAFATVGGGGAAGFVSGDHRNLCVMMGRVDVELVSSLLLELWLSLDGERKEMD